MRMMRMSLFQGIREGPRRPGLEEGTCSRKEPHWGKPTILYQFPPQIPLRSWKDGKKAATQRHHLRRAFTILTRLMQKSELLRQLGLERPSSYSKGTTKRTYGDTTRVREAQGGLLPKSKIIRDDMVFCKPLRHAFMDRPKAFRFTFLKNPVLANQRLLWTYISGWGPRYLCIDYLFPKLQIQVSMNEVSRFNLNENTEHLICQKLCEDLTYIFLF